MMHTTGKLIIFGGLVFTCWAGWQLGAIIPPQISALGLGGLMGVMAAIPAGLLAKQSAQRNENHYHAHLHMSAPKSLPSLPTLPTVRKIEQRPTRYRVVQSELTAATRQRIEVRK